MAENGFVFVSGGGRRKNDLGEKQEKKPNAIGNITNVPGDLKSAVENMKRQKEANQQQAALNQLEQSRRDYEMAAANRGIQEEKTATVEQELLAKQQLEDARQQEELVKQGGPAASAKEGETFWDIKKRISSEKAENTF
jgi:guanyl-specific ribonuclease Sa